MPQHSISRRDWQWSRLAALAAALAIIFIGGALLWRSVSNDEQASVNIPAVVPEGTPSPQASPIPAAPVAASWTISGGPDTPFDRPGGITVTPDGNIWVADGQNSRFQVFTPDGEFVETWGEPGAGDGQFDFASTAPTPAIATQGYGAIAFDSAGNLYVADKGNKRIQKFDANRSFVATWGSEGEGDGQFMSPADILVGEDGRVYVLDIFRQDVQVFDADGTFLFQFGGPGTSPGKLGTVVGMGFGTAGSVWIADFTQNRLQVFSSDGAFLRLIGSHDTTADAIGGFDVAIDGEGLIYLAQHGGGVSVFDWEGRKLMRVEQTLLLAGIDSNALSIAIDDDGAVYVTEFNQNEGHLQKYELQDALAASNQNAVGSADSAVTQTGVVSPESPVAFLWSNSGSAELPLDVPIDVEIAPDGSLWVLDSATERFHIFSPDGEFLETWGEQGAGDGQFAFGGESNSYGGFAFDASGNLYVAGTENQRVQKFDPDRNFVLSWGGEGDGEGQFQVPTDVAVNSTGQVYVLDSERSDIQVFSSNGEFLRAFEVRSESGKIVLDPKKTAIDDQDRIWVSDYVEGRLLTYSLTGDFVSSELGLMNPLGVDFDSAGRLFVAESGAFRLRVLDASGRQIATWGCFEAEEPIFSLTAGVAVDDQGNVYVTDYDGEQTHRLQKFMLSPEFFAATAALPAESVTTVTAVGAPLRSGTPGEGTSE